jgi:invasion protein IalB
MVRSARSILSAAVFGLAVAGAIAVAPATASAQDVQYIATHRDWHAFQFMEGGNRVCYVASKPTRMEPTTAKHGDVFMLVTDRPAEKAKNVVSLMVGYPLRTGSEVSVTIGSSSFQLFTDNNSAWSRDAASDAALVGAMRAGQTITVKGVSARGTNTTYSFSLLGITAALNEIERACGG